MECTKCKSVMTEVSRETVIDEVDEDITDGQLADYLAALESGDTGEWESILVTYKCEKCGHMMTESRR